MLLYWTGRRGRQGGRGRFCSGLGGGCFGGMGLGGGCGAMGLYKSRFSGRD